MGTRCFFSYIIDSQRVACIENMFCHRTTHVPQSDKTNAHSIPPFLASGRLNALCWYHDLLTKFLQLGNKLLHLWTPHRCKQDRSTVLTIRANRLQRKVCLVRREGTDCERREASALLRAETFQFICFRCKDLWWSKSRKPPIALLHYASECGTCLTTKPDWRVGSLYWFRSEANFRRLPLEVSDARAFV